MQSLASFSTLINVNTIIFEFLLYAVLSVGDFLLAREYENLVFRIFTDSLTHGLVGFFSWAIVIDLRPLTSTQWVRGLLQCIICMGLSMVVDVDHAIMARSLNLNDLVSLPSRPYFHATTIIIPIAAILWTLGDVYKDSFYGIMCPLFITAWLSHHLRDATRRGLWLPPFGSTPPLSPSLYITMMMILPVAVLFLLRMSKSNIVQTDAAVDMDIL
ncbi:transmembrane protein 267-like [Pecten maximus]|uniref:transmembrane protein 267-like n=1 Tax=Pecten maximus TaxID=6579 RepID=UPI001458C98C|nr:transmembrane protein 267-like [Pecten maximus]